MSSVNNTATQSSQPSPYVQAGIKLVDNGYSAIPIRPGTKIPGTFEYQRWRPTGDWTRYCDRLPNTKYETPLWVRWPDAGVCVALDHQLKVIDIDTDDQQLMDAILDVLPVSHVRKKGKKGFSAFYRGSDKIVSAPFNVTTSEGPVRVVDLLAYGRQTVLPPTLHPETGRPYEWIDGQSLIDTPIEALPELPDNIAELLEEALKPFGYVAEPVRTAVRGSSDSTFRGINDAALANLECWVPELNLPKTVRTHNGYRAPAAWRGGKNQNLSFHPLGITDWKTNETYTAIDVVMKARGVKCGEAADWLRKRLGMDEYDEDGSNVIEFVRNAEGATAYHSPEPEEQKYERPDDKPVRVRAVVLSDWTSNRYSAEPPPVEYLVEGAIEMGIPGIVNAMGDVGKSFKLLELCRRVALEPPPGAHTTTPPIFGGQVTRNGTAVFITAEDGEKVVHRRIAALDPKLARLSEKGERLIVVPLPDAGGPRAYWKYDSTAGLVETDDFKRFRDQLSGIRDLELVVVDPLATFAHAPINDDPAAGQFVCSSMCALAAELETVTLTAHHMRKSPKPIQTLTEAREAIRGTTALVDGMRLAFALWPAEHDRALRICKELRIPFTPNKIVLGGIVKTNGPARRIVATYVRNEFGLLVDRTRDLNYAAPQQDDLIGSLVMSVDDAALACVPFTKTGLNGIWEQKHRLPPELGAQAKHKLIALVDIALERGLIVQAVAEGSRTVKWLDVPTGRFALGTGEFKVGAPKTKVPKD